jgi:hypothetical protein
MPSANECELSSVYVRYTDVAAHGGISEESIKDNASFDLVLDLEAGQAIFNTGAAYSLSVVLNDLSASSKTIYTNTLGGSLGDANWGKMAVQFAWTVPPGTVAVVDGHVYQAIGVMNVGKADPIVDAEPSDLFIVTQP